MDFTDLLARQLPSRDVEVGGFTLKFQALSAKALDDLITEHPGDDGAAFSDSMVPVLVARSSVDPVMSEEQVAELFDAWSRPDVMKLQDAVFRLNFAGEEARQLPLSESG